MARSPARESRVLPLASTLAILALGAGSAAADELWVEGESAARHGMRRHGWYDSVDKSALSGGEWLSHFAAGDPPVAEYELEVERGGEHSFWIRCNPVAGPKLSYRLGDGDWTGVDLSSPLENVNIASDGKPDMRFVAWIDAGKVRLRSGRTRLRFRFESRNNRHGAIDCFLLTTRPFRPRGKLRPGERTGEAEPGFYAWEPDVDAFTDDALVDLRGLNEETAGQKGRVRRDGAGFVLGSGDPVRFWAVNAGPGVWRLDDGAHTYLARRLAKLGVNMVRLHGSFYGSRDPRVDPRRLERIQHLVHALKQEGIYSSLSFFFPLWFHLDGDRRPFMLLFFDEEMQRLHDGWADALLRSPNPHSGVPLGRDPAVAMVEIVNEDSHFFWTFGPKNTTPERWKRLEELYGEWAGRRHGSIEKAIEAWGGVREEGDDPDGGRLQLYPAWNMTTDGVRAAPRRRARVGDQVRFLTENMRGYYERTIRRLRSECRYEGLVSCGNWHVTDASKLDALERYCYTAGDVIDRHGYFDHGHQGEASTYSVRPGHTFDSRSALRLRDPSPIPQVETLGYPQIVSEIGWPMPNAYRAEFTFLTSTYGRLLGIDGIYHFALGGEGWDQQVGKFPISTPVTLGCFPATALVYRRGLVEEAPIVVLDRLRLEDLFSMQGTPVHVAGALDEFRARSIPEGRRESGKIASIDPLTFYAGRVARTFEGSPEESQRVGLEESIDRERKVVRSVTGELAWDYGRGVVTLDAPKAMGAAGFLGRAGRIEVGGGSIEMRNDYGTVMVVPLDDRPIASSRRILIQAMTIERFHGFRASGPDGLSGRIESVGSAPCGVEKVDARVTLDLEGPRPRGVVACDEHGYPRRREVSVGVKGSLVRITLDPESPYHVVRR